MISKCARIVPILILMAFLSSLVGCKGDSNTAIKQAGGTVIALAAAGFQGDFDLEAKPDAEAYMIEGFGVRSPGTHLSAHGTLNPGSVDPARLETLTALLERISAIEVQPSEATPEAGTEP